MRVRILAVLFIASLVAACSAPVPAAECEAPPPSSGVSALDCGDAVSAAVSALPGDHPSVIHVQFKRGFYCSPDAYCPVAPPSVGYVIFTFRPTAGPDTAAYIGVAPGDDGRARVSSSLIPILP